MYKAYISRVYLRRLWPYCYESPGTCMPSLQILPPLAPNGLTIQVANQVQVHDEWCMCSRFYAHCIFLVVMTACGKPLGLNIAPPMG